MNRINQFNKLLCAPRGFCLAKWYQVTIDLAHGVNHSCHHPARHQIPEKEVLNSTSALHNTEYKKIQRKKMLQGERPEECEYCWKIEDTPGNSILSDRFIKSTDDWCYDKLNTTLQLSGDEDIDPTYLEIMFNSTCNLSCTYCSSDISTSIENEIKKYGPYPVSISSEHRLSRFPKPKNPNLYINAFWNYFPKIYLGLKNLRITGGEPLFSIDTFKLFEYIENNKNPDLEFSINTNLSYDSSMTIKLIDHVRSLIKSNSIKKISIYTSIDGLGEQACYIRQGLNLNQFKSNLNLIIEKIPEAEVVIMCTYNVLSITSFDQLLEYISNINTSLNTKKIILDISYLKDPEYLRASIATGDLMDISIKSLLKMKALQTFSEYEISKFERVVKWMQSVDKNSQDARTQRSSFYSFINEFDKRYNTNFLSLFREYGNFYKVCKKSNKWETAVNKDNFS